MRRTACVDLPALPLQLLRARGAGAPGFAAEESPPPLAVVDRDRPRGILLWVDARARRRGILPGLTYAAARSRDRRLRAGTVPEGEIRAVQQRVAERLRRFSPAVEWEREAAPHHSFWLDASGLGRLYPSLRAWGAAIRSDLAGLGLSSTVAVATSRFGSWALARALSERLGGGEAEEAGDAAAAADGALRGVAVFETAREERCAVAAVPLAALDLEPPLRDALDELGIARVGDFLALPPEGLQRRFGAAAKELHRFASGTWGFPLQPRAAVPPLERRIDFEPCEADTERLLFAIKRALVPLLGALSARGEALAELQLHLLPEGPGAGREERIRCAFPTRQLRRILNLVHLRLTGRGLPGPLQGVILRALGQRPAPSAAPLFDRPRRDLAAADRALARVRAEFGDGAVVCARLTEGHLPEARFRWNALERLQPARPRAVAHRVLVRRLLARPERWPAGAPAHPAAGPYVVSGGWWVRPVHRSYFFLETPGGALLWIYRDGLRGTCYLHGTL